MRWVESSDRLRYPDGVIGDIVFGKSAREYFRDLVSEALSHRRLAVQEATEFYLVDLLARFLESESLFVARPDGTAELEPLAITLLRALEARRQARFERRKQLGDTSLFVRNRPCTAPLHAARRPAQRLGGRAGISRAIVWAR